MSTWANSSYTLRANTLGLLRQSVDRDWFRPMDLIEGGNITSNLTTLCNRGYLQRREAGTGGGTKYRYEYRITPSGRRHLDWLAKQAAKEVVA